MTRTALLAVVLAGSAVVGLLAQDRLARDRAMTPYSLGVESMRDEAFDAAAKWFQDAIDIDPSFEMAHYMLGRAEMARREYGRAIAPLERAREIYRALAGRQFATRQQAERVRVDRTTEIEEYIRQLQNGRQTQYTTQQIRQLEDQKRQINTQFDRGNNLSLELAVPAFVSLSLGSAYFRTGNLPEAERAYLDAVAADPKGGEAHNNLAVVYLETGRLADAEKSVKAAEKAGFRVLPGLKAEIAKRKGS